MADSRDLKVTLISAPQNPLGTLFYVWEQSRTNDPVPLPHEIEQIMNSTEDAVIKSSELGRIALMLKAPDYTKGTLKGATTTARKPDGTLSYPYCDLKIVRERVQGIVNQILDEDIPCTENLTFVFAIEHMSISLREQMVRHRIGVTIGDRTGIDIVPDIPKSSWWSQTMRMLPMGKFFSEGRYIMPDGLKDKSVILEGFHLGFDKDHIEYSGSMPADELYTRLLSQIEFVYNKLIESGVAMEDARQIIPIGATHSITWSLNLKAMMHIVGKRACWVAQANLWEHLIAGMVNELCDKVHPIFRKIILPPCFKKGKYNTCPYFQINKERVQGRDHMPPCPLYVYHETVMAVQAAQLSEHDTGVKPTWTPPYPSSVAGRSTEHMEAQRDVRQWSSTQDIEVRMLHENAERFERLWRLNVMTGEPLEVAAR